jgi:hypothetical protein
LRDEGTYRGKVNFYVIEVDSDHVKAEVKRWPGLGSHGLIGTTPDGQLKVVIPGHQFGKVEIIEKIDELLKLTGSG